MKLVIKSIEECMDRAKIEFEFNNGLCSLTGFDLLTHDQIETLELELLNAVEQLSSYRRNTNEQTTT